MASSEMSATAQGKQKVKFEEEKTSGGPITMRANVHIESPAYNIYEIAISMPDVPPEATVLATLIGQNGIPINRQTFHGHKRPFADDGYITSDGTPECVIPNDDAVKKEPAVTKPRGRPPKSVAPPGHMAPHPMQHPGPHPYPPHPGPYPGILLRLSGLHHHTMGIPTSITLATLRHRPVLMVISLGILRQVLLVMVLSLITQMNQLPRVQYHLAH